MNPEIENPHNAMESEEPHGKLSVLKKVKAKAKKIKHSFTKRAPGGHGHEEDIHDHGPDLDHDDVDDEDEDEDDDDDDEDEDEEMVEDPEIHGAPIYDSGAIKSGIGGHDVNHGRSPGVTFEEEGVVENHPNSPATTPVTGTNPSSVDDYPNRLDHGPEGDNGLIVGEAGKSTMLQEDPHAHKGVPDHTGAGARQAGISPLLQSFEKMSVHDEPKSNQDPHAHKGVPDPTGAGAKEAGISPIIQSFEKMGVHDEPKSNQDLHTKTPLHDQFSPEQSPHTKTPTHDQFSPEQSPHAQTPTHDEFSSEQSHPKNTSTHDEFSIDVTSPEKRPSHDQFPSELSPTTKTDADEHEKQSSNTYTEKLSYATTALAGTAISAKNVVASKLGYGPKDDTPVTQSPRESDTTKTPQSPSGGGYLSKISSTVTDKLGYGGPKDDTPVTQSPRDSDTTKTPQSPSGGGYLSKISSTVTDKLGYGPKDDTPLTQSPRGTEPTNTPQSEVAGGGGYMSTIAGKLGYGPKDETSVPQLPGSESKDKETTGGYLAPMYGKVASAGSTVLSKVTGSGTGTTDTTTDTHARETEGLGGKGPEANQSWMEKLKPGEGDKALFDTISEALYKPKDETSEHKEESKPMGKVTESENVARQLGTGDEETENVDESGEVKMNAADPTGANKGMVNMVKGAVTSWFGKGEPGQATEEKKVQEPSN